MRYLIFVIALFILLITTSASAHDSGEEVTCPKGTTPTIDGDIDPSEWSDANNITIQIEGNDCNILFKHDGNSLFVAFDIEEGHNSIFPDTRVYVDTDHDHADTPQSDDYQLYVNPDNGGLRERQGENDTWAEVDVTGWTGDWVEDNTSHWMVEYDISSRKISGNDSSSDPLAIAFFVYGNTFGVWSGWPSSMDPDDPSTWGHMSFEGGTPSDSAVALRGVGNVIIEQGKDDTVVIGIMNTGGTSDTFTVSVRGNSSSWMTANQTSFTLRSGMNSSFLVEIAVPRNAVVGDHLVHILARNREGSANATHELTITVKKTGNGNGGGGGGGGDDDDDAPGFEAALLALALTVVVLLAGRPSGKGGRS